MRNAFLLVIQAGLVAALAVGLGSGALPRGVRGEWEWPRLPRGVAPEALDLATGLAVVAAYAALAALGARALARGASRGREALALSALLGASIAVQALVQGAAPDGYGLTKWAVALHNSGSSGYYTVARRQIGDLGTFLERYPEWIRRQDALHVGTHPPGLFLVAAGLLRTMEARPGLARWVLDHVPPSVEGGFRTIAQYDPLPRADRAALATIGALTWLACAATVVPLYVLARAGLPPPAAWSAAALWPLVPSAILFQPAADTAFPLLATTALALAAHAGKGSRRGGLAAAFGAGTVLALGMLFTLAFLPIGLIAGIVLATSSGATARRRGLLILATGLGFLALTLASWAATRADPFVIWWWNQRNHARFYVEYRRSYLAWVLANPVELAVALGLPAAVWLAVGLWSPREAPRVSWATLAVLLALSLSGRNLSEVARLWLPMMPALLVASGRGLERLDGRAWTLGTTVFLLGVQTLALQAMIQVVYPF